MRELLQALAMINVINLREFGGLEPGGRMSMRIECVNKEWRERTKKSLEVRQKQIQKLLELEDKMEFESSAKVFLDSFPDRKTSKMSCYIDYYI